MPLGIYLFLLVSYTFKGALGSARYYESLTPFVCISAAYGASVIGERWRLALPLAFAAAFAHVVWLLVLIGRWTFHPGPTVTATTTGDVSTLPTERRGAASSPASL